MATATVQAHGTYVEASLGTLLSGGGSGTTDTGGSYFDGYVTNANFNNSSNFSLALGYQFSDLVRADLSYSQFKSNVTWQGVFVKSGIDNFRGQAKSNVLMTNLHLHGKGIRPDLFNVFDPFVTIGVGVAQNTLSGISEAGQNGSSIGTISSGTRNQTVYKLGIGADYALAKNLTLTGSADMLSLGGFQSGTERIHVRGPVAALGPWSMNSAPRLNLAVGLRYTF